MAMLKKILLCIALSVFSIYGYTQTVHQLHAILKPDINGNWFIQNDVDHASHGMNLSIGVVQGPDFLRLYFDPVYAKAGTVQISTDDGFAGTIQAVANLGTQNVTIQLRAYPNLKHSDAPINPAHIWSYTTPGNGNLWVNVSMVN